MRAIVSTILLSFIAIQAKAQSTNRLGGDPVLFDDDSSYWYLNEHFAPVLSSQNDTSLTPAYPGTAPANGLGIDARTTLAYAYQGQWILGATYTRYQMKSRREVVSWGQDALTQTTSRDEWGPTMGFAYSGWRVMFTYFLMGDQRVATKTTNYAGTTGDLKQKSKELDGYQLSLGYSFHLMGRVHLGPSLVYRAIKYHAQARANEFSVADSYDYRELYRANKVNALLPMIALDVRF